MFFIAYKNLFQEKTRLCISVIGTAFSIMLMLLLMGIYSGVSEQTVVYIKKNPAELTIGKEGTKDLYFAPSVISTDLAQEIKTIDGVRDVQGTIFLKDRYDDTENKKEYDIILASYDPGSDIGAPWEIQSGRQINATDEIVLDYNLAKGNKFKIEDTIKLLNTEFKIVGFSAGVTTFLAYYGFIHTDKSKELIKTPDVSNFLFAQLQDGQDETKIKEKIEAKLGDGYKVFTRDEFVDSNLTIISETLLPIILGMVLIGILVGTSVIGLTTYTSTIEKAKEYGLLKAIGIGNRQLYFLVLQQSIISVALGFIVGVLFAYIGKFVLSLFIPTITVNLHNDKLYIVAIFAIVMSILSTLIPIHKISRIDPATVFKS